jgi:hypothetical protein
MGPELLARGNCVTNAIHQFVETQICTGLVAVVDPSQPEAGCALSGQVPASMSTQGYKTFIRGSMSLVIKHTKYLVSKKLLMPNKRTK